MNTIMIFFFMLLATLLPQFAIGNHHTENGYNQQLVQGLLKDGDHIGKEIIFYLNNYKLLFNVML